MAAGGKGEGIVAQLGALTLWAESTGRKIDRGFDLSLARPGGLEHFVWHDDFRQVVMKFTYGGAFGRTVRSLDKGLVPATPLEYLTRWANHNELFLPITRVIGVLEANPDGLAILIKQDSLLGDLPSHADVEDFMRSSGYAPAGYHPSS